MRKPRLAAVPAPSFECLEQRMLLSVADAPAFTLADLGLTGERTLVAEGLWFLGAGLSPQDVGLQKTCNINAADTINADQLWTDGGLGLGLTGEGYIVGVWDEGWVRNTHEEFGTRVTNPDRPAGSDSSANHTTHVAGTIGAAGVDPKARGVASQVTIWSYNWTNDTDRMDEVASALVASNHSYGQLSGWEVGTYTYSTIHEQTVTEEVNAWLAPNREVYSEEDPDFGKYDLLSATIDGVLFDHPALLSVWAAMNERDDRYPGGSTYAAYFPDRNPAGWYEVETWRYPAPPRDGNGGQLYEGYDCLSQKQTAKNTLVVGAVYDRTSDPYDPHDLVAGFSSWGPTDDGRIKPDLVANGVDVYSTMATGNNAYDTMSGTSMAAPAVTGAAVLLIEHYEDLFSQRPLAATTKGLLIHTAVDVDDPGPDYRCGWGIMDAAAAANFLSEAALGAVLNQHSRLYEEAGANAYTGTVREYPSLVSDGTGPIKVTLCWTDPPGQPHGNGLDITTPVLVNDLDLWIEGPNGSAYYYAWTMNPAVPSANAARRVESTENPAAYGNHLDNVEQVVIDAPVAGTYTIHIGGTLGQGQTQQAYSLFVSSGISAPDLVDYVWGCGTIDTGPDRLDADNLTYRDNSSPDKCLVFNVAGTYAGSIVRIYADGTTLIGQATGQAGVTMVSTSGSFSLNDGEHTITARQVVGGVESADSFRLKIWIDTQRPDAPTAAPDLTPESDSGVSPQDNLTKASEGKLTFAVSGPTFFRLHRNGEVISQILEGESCTDIGAGSLAEGSYDYAITAVDAAGNESQGLGPALQVKIDRSTTVSMPLTETADTTPTLTGSMEPGATVKVTIRGVEYSTASNGNGAWTLADPDMTPALFTGDYEVTLVATDLAGNEATKKGTLRICLEPPNLETLDPYTENGTYTVHWGLDGAYAYVLERDTSREFPDPVGFWSSATQYEFEDLEFGVRYYYRVRAGSLDSSWVATTKGDFERTDPGDRTNVVITEDGNVQLAETSVTGCFVSEVIDAFLVGRWGKLLFGADTPGDTTLTVDILDESREVIVTGVASGTDLNGILNPDNPAHWKIYLEANFGTTTPGVTPVLHNWAVTWLSYSRYEKDEYLPGLASGVTDSTRALFGTEGDDHYCVRLDPEDTNYVQVLRNGTQVMRDNGLLGIAIAAQGGEDTVDVDFTNGSPVPKLGLLFDGGDDADTFTTVNGSSCQKNVALTCIQTEQITVRLGSGSDRLVLEGAMAVFNPTAEGAPLQMGEGDDTLLIDGGTVTFNASADGAALEMGPGSDTLIIEGATATFNATADGAALEMGPGADTLVIQGATATFNEYVVDENLRIPAFEMGTSDFEDQDTVSVTGGSVTFNQDVGYMNAKGCWAVTVNVSDNADGRTAVNPTVRFTTSQHLAALNLTGKAYVILEDPDGGVSNCILTQVLTFSPSDPPTATLDLMNNNLIVDYAPGSSPLVQIAQWVRAGFHLDEEGYWDGPGIRSSTAANDGTYATAVGVLDNSHEFLGGLLTLEDESVDNTCVLVKFTWWGDIDYDGQVTLTDYNLLLYYFFEQENMTPDEMGWWSADLDYDGTVTLTDYNMLLYGFLTQTGPL